MSQANINPKILTWARERAEMSHEILAQKLHVREEKLAAWEAGEAKPTFKQAQDFAKQTFVPFGYLFLRHPPEERLLIPDLRTVGDHPPGKLSVNLVDVIKEVLGRQIWYKEYQREQEASPVSVVGRANSDSSVLDIVSDMRTQLGIDKNPRRGDWEAYQRDLVSRIERTGILVMRSGMVGNNTHRLLNVNEFRGFALSDKNAPIIFVNTADCPEARLFTLIHELSHIWINVSGLSDADPSNQRKTEKLCNSVAAELLAPSEEFVLEWSSDIPWRENLARLSAHFHVSQWVITRRAFDLGLIEEHSYRDYVAQKIAEHRAREKKGTIVPFNRIQPNKVSKRFARAVAGEALSGRLLLREAHQLIGVKPHKLGEFAQKELSL